MNNSLLMLAKEVRSKTLWLLDGVTDEMALFAAPGLANTILWHAGHVLVVIEHLGIAPSTGQLPMIPEGWFEKFSWDSKPQAVTDWPNLREVVGALQDQLPRLVTAIAALSHEQLELIPDPASGTTLHYDLVHGLHDEANHQGEVWLLRKMYVKRLLVAV